MSFLSFFCQGKMHFSIQASIALCNTKCVKFNFLNFTMLATTDFFAVKFCRKNLLLQAQILYPLRDTKSACQGKIPKTLKTKNAEFGACDFRFAPHQKNRNFLYKKSNAKFTCIARIMVLEPPCQARGVKAVYSAVKFLQICTVSYFADL